MVEFAGRTRDDAGAAIQGAVVTVYDEGTSTPSRGTDTTDVNGEWDITVATRGPYDVEIVNGTDVIWWNARDQYQGQTLQLWQPTANEVAFEITRAEDAASVEVGTFEGDRATMGDNDEAYVSFKMSDDGGTQTEVGRLTWVITDVTDTTEDGRLDFAVMTAGTLADELQLDGAALSPSTNDGIALGTTALGYADLHLASGGVINWANGEVTLTETDANTVTLTGGDLILTDLQSSGQVEGTTGNGFLDLAGDSGASVKARLTDAGLLLIGDTANANMTVGLTINQGANDDAILVLKSSDVAHVITSDAEADTFGNFRKFNSTAGGLVIEGFRDADASGGEALVLRGMLGKAADTTDTTTSVAVTHIRADVTDGATGTAAVADAGNAVALDNAGTVHFIMKGNGDLHVTNTTLIALDDDDDVQLVRAMQKLSASDGIIENQYDNPFYDHQYLREKGLAGLADENGVFLFPLQKRMHAHEGAIWQIATKLYDALDRLSLAESKLAALPQGA